jgi:hypothetical protein
MGDAILRVTVPPGDFPIALEQVEKKNVKKKKRRGRS